MPIASVMLGMPAGVGILAGLLGAVTPVNYWTEVKGNIRSILHGTGTDRAVFMLRPDLA